MYYHALIRKIVLTVCLSLTGIELAGAQTTQPVKQTTQPATASAPACPPKDKPIPLSFNNAPLKQIADFLSCQMGKPVIIRKEVENIRVTLVNPKPLPPEEALAILNTALNEAGVAVEERSQTIHLISIDQINQAKIRTIPAEADLKSLKPANQIVRKIFELRYYDPTKLVEVIKPLLPSYSHITADPTTGKLMIVASVDKLITVSQIIGEFDKPDVTGSELRVFQIKNVDVYEVIPMLEKLISGYLGFEVKAISATGGMGGPNPGAMGGRPMPPGQPGGGKPSGTGIISVKADNKPILIIPDPRRSSIVVAAPANVLSQVGEWLATLDQPKPPSTQTEIIEVQFADVDDLTNQLMTMLNNIPDESLRNSLKLFPFPSSRRLMIVGSEQNRALIKSWLKEIDIQNTGVRITQTFTLKYADAQQVAENVKELFDDNQFKNVRVFFGNYSQPGSDRSKVSVTANVRRNSLTIVASPEKMQKIAEQIAEWDKPFEGEEAAPRIFTLRYADPDKTKELLESLFSKKEKTSRPWWWDDGGESETAPVGRLFGQFRFEAYPETSKLIVVSKNEENYKVIEDIITRLDQPQTGGMPRVIQLKFADAETLAEQLNALLNAPGTPATILRRGLAKPFEGFSDGSSPFSKNNDNQQYQQPQQQNNNNLSMMQFWWQNPPADVKVKQPSNLIGKLRIVPNVEQNSLMVAAPEEYFEAIEKFVADVDKPGYRVLIKAVIAEITHEDTMSLGYRFSSDPSLFTSGDPDITENAIRGLLTYQFEDTFGRQNTLSINVDVNNLVSLLKRVTDIEIKSEPKILAADNVEAEFFDGQDIPFISQTLTTDVGSQNVSFEYFPVGIRLRVRPHITKERNIDLTVNLLVSNVVPGQTLFGGAIVDRRETTTRVMLEDGKTFLISGILRQEDRQVIRRVPGLGDIPGLGELFKHRECSKVNSELLIFLTPYVICPKGPYEQIQSIPMEEMNSRMTLDGPSMEWEKEPACTTKPAEADEECEK
jgi:general secretion pathway protein D